MADNKRKVLAIGAHDDDVLIGVGGILRARHQDDEIRVHIMTNGQSSHELVLGIVEHPTPGEVAAARRRESEEAYRVLAGGSLDLGIFGWDYVDGGGRALEAAKEEVVGRMESLLKDYMPDIVYFHAQDSNKDHRLTHKVVSQAMERAEYRGEAHLYFIWTKEFASKRPPGLHVDMSLIQSSEEAVTIDIQTALPFKERALYCFRSQVQVWPYPGWQPQDKPILDAGFIKHCLRGKELVLRLR